MRNPKSWLTDEIEVGMFYTGCCLHDAERIDENNIEEVCEQLEDRDEDEIFIDVYATIEDLIEGTKGCGLTIKDRPDLEKWLNISL